MKYFSGKVGWQQLSDSEILVYPNPVLNELTVSAGDESGSKNLMLYNMQGKLVLSKIITGAEAKINLESLTKGIYLLSISNEKINMNKLILKN